MQKLICKLQLAAKIKIFEFTETILPQDLLHLSMKEVKLKAYLNQIADRLTEDSSLEDVYEQLFLLAPMFSF